jgi:hypothetical protein
MNTATNVRRAFRIALTLWLTAIATVFFAQDEPAEDVFTHSSRELAFQIPAGFELVGQDRRYLNQEAHEVPRFQRIWRHGFDMVMINVVVVPDAAWQQKTPKQIFADGMSGMLSDPTLKIVSQRSYELDDCAAESVTCFYQGGDGTSQRMDCFLARPNMFIVAYVSSKPSSWDDPASKVFFQSVSLKPKK